MFAETEAATAASRMTSIMEAQYTKTKGVNDVELSSQRIAARASREVDIGTTIHSLIHSGETWEENETTAEPQNT